MRQLSIVSQNFSTYVKSGLNTVFIEFDVSLIYSTYIVCFLPTKLVKILYLWALRKM